jgi:hypothetical protein
MITVSFYPAGYEECPGEFAVQRQVEWLVCDDPADPGGTGVWPDYAVDDVTEVVIGSAGEAGRRAREFAGPPSRKAGRTAGTACRGEAAGSASQEGSPP